ncbi:ENL/AF9-related superfamily elongation complex transcription factor [Xylocopa sonorina]|uniref:ENL/AF9-related superfamily elongation complex transcription factor n=1 Tax=Xylocopa sonorina TaxID=1818115 RepID=UPI00403A92CD
MAIRITLECGHASVLRVHTTPEGYTHDWEVFVRGIDNADIHHYVEKVVFQLHDTFPKPRRVLKEPPFVVKQSGYAGFEIPIHIYFKNKDENPKKIEILYDLNLQSSGPAITNVVRHSEIIHNPSDEFRRKLLKGGGVLMTSSESSAEKSETKTPAMVGKPKLSGSDSKKHKSIESKTSNSFAELFGTPLKPTKVSQDNKKPPQPEKSSASSKSLVTTEKADKVDKTKLKDSPHKDSRKEKVDDKKDKKVKDQSKDKNRSKEKSKRPPSPGNKSHSSPSNKRPPSPPSVPLKRPPSPSLPPAKRPASPKSKDKELKKPAVEKEKDKSKEKDKVKDSSKNVADSSKSEKKKDKKKHKEDRDKERKDKYKEGERSVSKETVKLAEKKSDKPEKSEKPEKEKSQEYKSAKDGRKSPKPPKESEKPKDEKLAKVEKSERTEKSDKTREGKSEKDRQKHKHKKRDKKDKRDSSKDRDKKEKRDRIKSSSEKQNNVPNVPPNNPIQRLLEEMRERDSSDSAPSIDDDSFSESKAVPATKKETENLTVSTPPLEMAKPLSPAIPDIKKEKIDRIKREKPKGSKGEEKETRKRKRRSDSKGDEEHAVKREKDRGHSTSPPLEPVSSSQSPVVVDQETVHMKEVHMKEEPVVEKGIKPEVEQVAPDSTNNTLVDSDMGEPPVFSEDYVSQLKDLQQKIMTLQDNQELQRVVQVIAETGQYEITKKTFDFDLCALDRRTVQRLQQFFAS